MYNDIRRLIALHGRLPVRLETIGDRQNLFVAGLSSFAAVQVMLALEEFFDVEFDPELFTRRTFESIDAIARNLAPLLSKSRENAGT